MITSCMDERDERKRSSDDASKGTWTASKPGSPCCSGISVEDTYLLTMRCPVFRRRDFHPGFRSELETLVGHAKGKGRKRWTREAESTDGPVRRGLPHSSDEAGQCPWSEGGGSLTAFVGSTGDRRNPAVSPEGASLR